jgi:hypothetical protein
MALRLTPSRYVQRVNPRAEYVSSLFVLLCFAAVLSPLYPGDWRLSPLLAAATCLWLPFEVRRIHKCNRRRRLDFTKGLDAFAREFDCLQIDACIIGATYEVFACHCDHPVAATDRLTDHLEPDAEFSMLLRDIAKRCGRSLDDVAKNPAYKNMNTVGDIVRLLSKQPWAKSDR